MPADEKNGVISSLYTADGKVKLPRTVDKAVTITTGEHRGKTLDQVLEELTQNQNNSNVDNGIALANEFAPMPFAAYSGEEEVPSCGCDPEECRRIAEEIARKIVEERMQEVYDYINLMMQKDIEILSFDCLPKTNFNKGEVVEKIHLVWELNVEPVSVHISDIGEVEAEMNGCEIYKKPITDTTTFVLTVTDKKGNVKNAEVKLTFGEEDVQQPEQPPVVSGASCIYGIFTENLDASKIISGQKIKMMEETSITVSFHNQRVFFAYPVSQGLLSEIKDRNGFSYLDSFILEEFVIGSERYYAYYLDERSSGKEAKFIFIL